MATAPLTAPTASQNSSIVPVAVSASKTGWGKIIAVVAVILAAMVGLGIAGAAYVGYRANKKVGDVEQKVIGLAKKETDAVPSNGLGGGDPSSLQVKQDEEAGGPSGLGVLNKILGDSPPMPM